MIFRVFHPRILAPDAFQADASDRFFWYSKDSKNEVGYTPEVFMDWLELDGVFMDYMSNQMWSFFLWIGWF